MEKDPGTSPQEATAPLETEAFLDKESENLYPKDISSSKDIYISPQKRLSLEEELPQTVTQVNGNVKVERTGWQRYIGIILTLISSISFSLCILIVKYLNEKINGASFGFYRFTGVLLSLPILLYFQFVKNGKIFRTVWPLDLEHKGNIKTAVVILFRGVGGCTAILLQYYSVEYITIATATTITFSTPIFVGLFARLCLGEKCGVVSALAAIITFCGVLITTKILPGLSEVEKVGLDKDNLIGSSLAFGSMIFATCTFIVLRYLRRVHFTLVTTSFGIIGLIQSGIVCAVIGRFDVPDSSWEWFLVASVGFLTFLSQTLMTCALKFENAGPIALCRTLDVVFAFIWQYMFLDVVPDVYSVLGAFIVCTGIALIAFQKYLSTLPQDHKRRKKFGIFLK